MPTHSDELFLVAVTNSTQAAALRGDGQSCMAPSWGRSLVSGRVLRGSRDAVVGDWVQEIRGCRHASLLHFGQVKFERPGGHFGRVSRGKHRFVARSISLTPK